MKAGSLERFGPATRAWFNSVFAAPTRVQEEGWAHIAGGNHALLLAPTGSGKTLAAFLWCLDRLTRLGPEELAGVRVLDVSPLKALAAGFPLRRSLRMVPAMQSRLSRSLPGALSIPRWDR